jgi:hypothetical protein
VPTVATTASVRVPAPREALFAWFIPIELPRILHRYGPIPAVVRTSGQSGPWDVVGSGRTVHLGDGSTARERVTGCERPQSFAYTVDGFSGPVRHLVREGRGRWRFEPAADDPDATEVRWTYAFEARSRAAALLLTPVVKLAWRGFMRRALGRLARLARDEAR